MTKQSRSMGSSSVQNKNEEQRKKRMNKNEGKKKIISDSAAVAYSNRVQSGEPLISVTRDSKRVRHRELIISTITGATAFAVTNWLQLNPGLASVFPWLSNEASNWEQYKVYKMVAQYIPIAPSSTQGDVLLSPEYDASDPQPTTEVQAANNKDSVMDSCWKRIDCALNPKSMMAGCGRKFVRTTAVAGDVKTFDVGRLAVCVNNASATPSFGKLFLDYDIEFFVPQNSPGTETVPLYTSIATRGANQTFTTAVEGPLQFTAIGRDPLNIGSAATGVFTPPAGCYRIDVSACFADSNAELFTGVMTIYKNGAVLNPTAASTVSGTDGVGQTMLLSVRGVISMNGSDTFQIQILLTAAAGTLTYLGASAQMLISLA